MEEPSQFSVGQTAQSLTCSFMEKPHTVLDDCLRILLSCFRKKRSGGYVRAARYIAMHCEQCNDFPSPNDKITAAAVNFDRIVCSERVRVRGPEFKG